MPMKKKLEVKQNKDREIKSELVAQKFKLKMNRRNTAFSLDVPKGNLEIGDEFNLEQFFDKNKKCVKLVFTKVYK